MNVNYSYVKKNQAAIPIESVPDEHEEKRDFQPSFWYNNRRYFIDDFTRVHNNPWVSGDFPEYIHGMEADEYYNPIFIEMIGDAAVNVYEEVCQVD